MKHKNTVALPGMPGIDGPNPQNAPTLLPFRSHGSEQAGHEALERLNPAEKAGVDQRIADIMAHHPELGMRQDRSSGSLLRRLGWVASYALRKNGQEGASLPTNAGTSSLDLIDVKSLAPSAAIQVSRLLNGVSEADAAKIGLRRLGTMKAKAQYRTNAAIHRSMPGTAVKRKLPRVFSGEGKARKHIKVREKMYGEKAAIPEFTPKEQSIIINLALAETAEQVPE
ncbi:hypothetical protein JNM87_04610 [Candidatus Saccharibacteria bacterium]|nr:hypothetical protein [Candidatus Saccharibacteria bacterium]